MISKSKCTAFDANSFQDHIAVRTQTKTFYRRGSETLETRQISRYLIYLLIDPRTGEVRYVGKSTTGPNRANAHWRPSNLKRSSYKVNWLKQLASFDLVPDVFFKEYGPEDPLGEIEIFWIALGRAWGCRLTNLTTGGEGTTGYRHTDASRKKMSEKLVGRHPTRGFSGYRHLSKTKIKGRSGPVLSPETRAVIAEKLKGRRPSSQTIAASIAASTGRKASSETKAKMSAAHLGKKHTAESRAKISIAKRLWTSR